LSLPFQLTELTMITVVLIVVLLLLLAGGRWGYRQPWYHPAYGYGGGTLGLVLLILLILLLTGYWTV